MVMPGDNIKMVIGPIAPIAMEGGLRSIAKAARPSVRAPGEDLK
jgi:translation elongation factor EF-Tu-like GTPase